MTGEGIDVLIVDNDERIVELVAWFLERRGYTVRSAGSFDAARVALNERRPTLMLSDVDLGEQNACEELPRLDREGLLPPTLVVSGFLTAELRAELLALEPVLDTLAKPFEFEELERRMVACLAQVGESASISSTSAGHPSQTPADSGLRAGESEDDEGWIEVRPAVSLDSGEAGSE
ncbi:MAG TPA: response regulator [Planctomycetes bacterium]|nr:response regulator [Planctomycetota bacterium]HIK61978.1 response regulator [Planctomycetota bacterium]